MENKEKAKSFVKMSLAAAGAIVGMSSSAMSTQPVKRKEHRPGSVLEDMQRVADNAKPIGKRVSMGSTLPFGYTNPKKKHSKKTRSVRKRMEYAASMVPEHQR